MNKIEIYAFRDVTSTLLKEMLTQLMEKHSDVGLIIIDQVADLVKSINSEQEAINIVRYLKMLAEEKQIHICTVLHQNKGDGLATGWIGSQLLKKAETVFSVEKVSAEKGVDSPSVVMPMHTRNREFEEFELTINDLGIPVINGGSMHPESETNIDDYMKAMQQQQNN